MSEPARPSIVRFGLFEADLAAGELRKNGLRVKVQEKPFQLLALLLEKGGEVVTRDELREKLWPAGTFVDFDHGLNTAINKLREALGDRAENPRFIETLPRRGYRFIAPLSVAARLEPTGKERRPGASFLSRGNLAAAGLMLALGSLGVYYLFFRAPLAGNSPTAAAKIMLAVLPFKNLSPDPEQDFFSEGVSEEMIARLGGLHPERLGVIARTTVMQYKNTRKSIAEIGRELGVDYVVEGSVRRAGERVRITAQLIEVWTQNVRWADSYERGVAEVLSIQREVAGSIARALAVEVLPAATASPPANTDSAAFESYLRGLFFREQLTEEALSRSIENYQEAIARDPGFAPAYAALADAYRMTAAPGWEFVPQEEVIPKARRAAEKALELDGKLAEPHAVLGMIELFYDWDLPAAEREMTRAIELNPSLAKAYVWYSSCLTASGRMEEALAAAERGQKLDPLSPTALQTLGIRYYYAGLYERARTQLEKTLELHPGAFVARLGLGQIHWRLGEGDLAIAELDRALDASGGSIYLQSWLGYFCAASGHRQRALTLLEELEETSRTRYVSPFHRALIYTGLGDNDQAMIWLERAFAERSGWMVFLNVEPEFQSLRSNKRFLDLLRRIGFRV
jgi:TolB-like protein/DNA-binding winged helix-turn-helix (wHTH) protein